MGDSMGHRSDVKILADGQETTFPIGEWTAFLERLQTSELERWFESGGPEAQTAYRKLLELAPTTAA